MNPLKVLKEYVVLIVGVFIYSAGWELFFVPNKMTSGGLTGLCTIIEFGTGIPLSISYAIMNVALLIVAVFILGKSFGMRTLLCIGMSAFFLWLLALPVFDPMRVSLDNRLLIAVVGALIEGVGIGMTLMAGGSTGGSDIIAMVINKFYPVSLGKVYFTMDLFIVASLLLVPGMGFEDLIYGYIIMIIFSYTVDAVVLGRKSTVQIMIFSKKYQEIADYLVHDLDKGVTAINCVGWYTGQETKVLFVLCRKSNLHEILASVKNFDEYAFMSVSSANAVYGEGFEEVKLGFKKKNLSNSLTNN